MWAISLLFGLGAPFPVDLCDHDGDGSTWDLCGGPDCNDFDATIGPHGREAAGNGIDEDCDGRDLLVRHWFSDFGNDARWTGPTSDGDVVVVDASSKPVGPDSEQVLASGRPALALSIEQASSAVCEATFELRESRSGATETLSVAVPDAAGTHVLDVPTTLMPPLKASFSLACTAGSLTLDWAAVQNSNLAAWPPGADIEITWEGMALPGGGAYTRLVEDADGNLFAASDVAGVAFRDADTGNWSSANGLPDGLSKEFDLDVWDLRVGSTGAVWAVSGKQFEPWIEGGLWSTTDLGSTWQRRTSDVGVYGRIDHCVPSGSDPDPARAGGRLLVEVDGGILVANHEAGVEGVALLDDADNLCALDIPVAYPSALAVGTDLVVGWKGRGTSAAGVARCSLPSPVSCADVGDIVCLEVSGTEGIDVRDLEVDPLDPDLVFIADGGRHPDGSGICTYQNGTVWTLDLATETLVEVAGLNGMLEGGSAPSELASEVVGIALDPEGTMLFAVLPGGNNLPYTRNDSGSSEPNGRVWRIAWDDAISGGGAWQALSGTDRTDRRAVVDAVGHWLEPQPDLELWAPSLGSDLVHLSSENDLMVLDGYGVWRVSGALDDWSVDTVDAAVGWHPLMDQWGAAGPHQATVAPDVALASTGRVHAALNDLSYAHWDPGSPAYTDCVWNELGEAGRAIDAVTTDSGEVIWLGLGATSTAVVLRSDDDGDTWCFQGTASTDTLDDALVCKLETSGSAGIVACDSDTAATPGLALDGLGQVRDVVGLPGHGEVAFAAFKAIDGTRGGVAYTVDAGQSWVEVGDFHYDDNCLQDDFFGVDATIAIHPDSTFVDADDYAFRLFVGGQFNGGPVADVGGGPDVFPCGVVEVVIASDLPDVGAWAPLHLPRSCRIDGENLFGLALDPDHRSLWVWGEVQPRDGDPVGGICRVPLEHGRADPVLRSWQHRWDPAFVLVHPWVADVALVSPRVSVGTESEVLGLFGVPADEPHPLVVERTSPRRHFGSWVTHPLPTNGLQGWNQVGLAADPSFTTIVASGQGTGVAQGLIGW